MPAPRHAEVRQRVQELAGSCAQATLELAWMLGLIRDEELFREWTNPDTNIHFASFREYIDTDLRGAFSQAYLYMLSDVGRAFKKQHGAIERAVTKRHVGIAKLIDLAGLVKRGLPVVRAVEHIEHAAPLPGRWAIAAELQHPDPDPEGPATIPTMYVPRGDFAHIMTGLVLYAVRHQCQTPSETLRDFALGERANEQVPKAFLPFLADILNGTFKCKKCEKIPLHPTPHHVIPQSLAQGRGPVVILCLAPCHPIVQAEWQEHAILWYGKRQGEEWLRQFKGARP